MAKIKPFFSICIAVIMTTQVSAQTFIATGKILDPDGAPVAGATVSAPNGKTVLTDGRGEFAIQASEGQKLMVTAVGYSITSVAAGKQAITVKLQSVATELSTVTIGSRGAPRSVISSPVPVDVVKMGTITTTMARPDLMSQLMVAVPSFNFNKQSGSDIADAVDFATLRGMGYDHTLVLINGTRRHTTAYVSLGGLSGSGTDMNTIPLAAIDHIEVLRDGASAQYGSDAIAGVINVVLKKDIRHFTMNAGWSGYYDSKFNTLKSQDPSKYYSSSYVDGNAFNASMDWGFSIGKKGGFFNIGASALAQGKTFRANPDSQLIQTRRAFGDGSVASAGSMYNMEIPIGSGSVRFYSFGGYNYKHSNNYAWTRKFSNPLRFPTDANGNLIFVPSIMHVTTASDGSFSSANVFYNPQEDTYMTDASGAFGVKGSTPSGWDWDLTNNTGYSDVHIWGNKTFNTSLPLPDQAFKNRFDDGGFNFTQNTSDLDVSRRFPDVAEGMTLSFGGEFRYEKYHLYAGEPDSYRQGGATLNGSPKTSGSQGYPGYQPLDAVKAHRTNVGGYADLSFDLTKAWLLEGAARFENYSDFGFVNVYKLATRYKVNDQWNIRGALSTGFRAPTLQELNFSETNTVIINGQLQYSKTVPNYSEVAKLAGIPKLKQETSTNYSAGFTWQPSKNFTATVDGYLIKMRDRIVVTGFYDASTPALTSYLNQNSLHSVNFFANAVNTTNTGIDVVLDYHNSWNRQHFNVLLTGNIQKVTIDKVNMPSTLGSTYLDYQNFFGTQPQYSLIASAPHAKFSLSPEYGINAVTFGLRWTYWGKIVKVGNGSASVPGAKPDGPGGANISASGNGWDPYVQLDDGSNVVPEEFVYRGKITTDFYFNYKISKAVSWIVGVDNLFNVHPDPAYTKGARQNSWNDFPTGGYFDNVQMGFNGMRMFSKLLLKF